MRWLLDTNVISEMIKPRPNAGVIGWLTERAGDEPRLYISALTLAEIYRGALRLDQGSRLYARLHAWLTSDVAARFARRILPFDQEVARTWGPDDRRAAEGDSGLDDGFLDRGDGAPPHPDSRYAQL
jgi:predicted nucleic acid-binding protein